MDLTTLSLPDLKQLQKDIAKAITNFEDRKKSEARAELESRARELGFSLSELVGASTGRARLTAPAKFRHPENSELTWSGRGRRPHWFNDALAAGSTEDSLAI